MSIDKTYKEKLRDWWYSLQDIHPLPEAKRSEVEKIVKKALTQTRIDTLKEVEEIITKKISIHKELSGQHVGKLSDLARGVYSENPHTFVIEQLGDILTHIQSLLDKK